MEKSTTQQATNLCNPFSACYQEEISPHKGKYCKDHYDHNENNICDGTKNDCVSKGKEICWSDPNCYGIMYHSSKTTGLKLCTSRTLQEKPEKDWSVFMKCDSGMYYAMYIFIQNNVVLF